MPDFNEDAARVIAESTATDEGMPESIEQQAAATSSGRSGELIEAAWTEWSQQIQRCDERTMTLLRAAFEAGADAAQRLDQSKSSS